MPHNVQVKKDAGSRLQTANVWEVRKKQMMDAKAQVQARAHAAISKEATEAKTDIPPSSPPLLPQNSTETNGLARSAATQHNQSSASQQSRNENDALISTQGGFEPLVRFDPFQTQSAGLKTSFTAGFYRQESKEGRLSPGKPIRPMSSDSNQGHPVAWGSAKRSGALATTSTSKIPLTPESKTDVSKSSTSLPEDSALPSLTEPPQNLQGQANGLSESMIRQLQLDEAKQQEETPEREFIESSAESSQELRFIADWSKPRSSTKQQGPSNDNGQPKSRTAINASQDEKEKCMFIRDKEQGKGQFERSVASVDPTENPHKDSAIDRGQCSKLENHCRNADSERSPVPKPLQATEGEGDSSNSSSTSAGSIHMDHSEESFPDSLQPYERSRDPSASAKSDALISTESSASGHSIDSFPNIHPQYRAPPVRPDETATPSEAEEGNHYSHGFANDAASNSNGPALTGQSLRQTSAFNKFTHTLAQTNGPGAETYPSAMSAVARNVADCAPFFEAAGHQLHFAHLGPGFPSPHALPYGTPMYFDGTSFYPAAILHPLPMSSPSMGLLSSEASRTFPRPSFTGTPHTYQKQYPEAPHFDPAGYHLNASQCTSQEPVPGSTENIEASESFASSSASSALIAQIEFYFSPQNLLSDLFLRQQMDPEHGFVPLALIATFKRLRRICEELGVGLEDSSVQESLHRSESVELDREGRRVRKRFGWREWVLAEGTTRPHATFPACPYTNDILQPNTSSPQEIAYANAGAAALGGISSAESSQHEAYRAWLLQGRQPHIGSTMSSPSLQKIMDNRNRPPQPPVTPPPLTQTTGYSSSPALTPYTGGIGRPCFYPSPTHGRPVPGSHQWSAADFASALPNSMAAQAGRQHPELMSNRYYTNCGPYSLPCSTYTYQGHYDYQPREPHQLAASYGPDSPHPHSVLRSAAQGSGPTAVQRGNVLKGGDLVFAADERVTDGMPSIGNSSNQSTDACGSDVIAISANQGHLDDGEEGSDDYGDEEDDEDDECLGVIVAEGLGGLVDRRGR